jgi:hypothetical protein
MLSEMPIPPVTAAAVRASKKRKRRGPRRVATGFAGAAITNSLSLLSTTLRTRVAMRATPASRRRMRWMVDQWMHRQAEFVF